MRQPAENSVRWIVAPRHNVERRRNDFAQVILRGFPHLVGKNEIISFFFAPAQHQAEPCLPTGYYDSWQSHDSCKASISTQDRRKKIAAEILDDYQQGKSIEQIMKSRNITERKVKAQLKKANRDKASKLE